MHACDGLLYTPSLLWRALLDGLPQIEGAHGDQAAGKGWTSCPRGLFRRLADSGTVRQGPRGAGHRGPGNVHRRGPDFPSIPPRGTTAARRSSGRPSQGKREKVFLATKVSGSDHSFDHIDSALEESLRVLRTDYVDLYQIHGPQPQWPIEQTMARLLHHRDAGKNQVHRCLKLLRGAARGGVPVRYAPQLPATLQHARPWKPRSRCCRRACSWASGVMAHSVLAQSMLSGKYKPGHQFAEDDSRSNVDRFRGDDFQRIYQITERLKAWAADRGRDLVQLAIAWPLAHPALTSSIIGIKSPEQAKHAAMAADWRLTQQELDEIEQIQGKARLHWADRSLQLSFEG